MRLLAPFRTTILDRSARRDSNLLVGAAIGFKRAGSTLHVSNRFRPGDRSGAALVVVLVLLVLLLGVVLAFFSQSLLQKQVSRSSAGQTSAALLADGAVSTVLGDLRQEMVNGSTEAVAGTTKIYRPTLPANAVPEIQPSAIKPAIDDGNEVDGLNNLVKISTNSALYPGGPVRGSNESTLPASAESVRGSVSKARWNRALLLPPMSAQDLTPRGVPDAAFPKWIYINREGTYSPGKVKWTASTVSSRDVILGRYAFAIYNEGGLLDANSAGYPAAMANQPASGSEIKNQTGYKSSLAYADLTEIPGLDQGSIEKFLSWRQSATLASGNPRGNFFRFATSNPGKFLSAFFPGGSHGSDHVFVSRQQLIGFFSNQLGGGDILGSLQYLGTRSRYLNQPSYWPDPQRKTVAFGPATGNSSAYSGGNDAFPGREDALNPAFRKIRVTSPFTRNDGSPAKLDEPLVKKRFPLNRLLWLTYRGPSQQVSPTDPLFSRYESLGMPHEDLERLRLSGTTENIAHYFGLSWKPGGYWTYDQVNSDGQIKTLAEVAKEGREPNFFELLQAAINAGSLAKGIGTWGRATDSTSNWYIADTYLVWQILQIGADIIENANPTRYPLQLRLTVDGTENLSHKIFGTTDLPYFYAFRNMAFPSGAAQPPLPAGRPANADPESGATVPADGSGQVAVLTVPTVWSPYFDNSSELGSSAKEIPSPTKIRITAASEDPTGNSLPASFRPQIKCEYSGGTKWLPPNQSDAALVKWQEADTAMIFDYDPALYREPTVLFRPGYPSHSELQMEGSRLIDSSGVPEIPGSEKFIGWSLGMLKQRWTDTGKIYSGNKIQMNPQTITINGVSSGGFTVRMYYQTAGSSQWTLYKEYWTGGDGGDFAVADNAQTNSGATILSKGSDGYRLWDTPSVGTKSDHWPSRITWDPRTARWGTPGGLYPTDSDPLFRFLSDDPDQADSTVQSVRPTKSIGDGIQDFSAPIGWKFQNRNAFGGVSQNLTGSPQIYYADPDGVIRRAMGGAVGQCSSGANADNGQSALGLPMASTQAAAAFKNIPAYTPPSNQAASRPVILHRPYRSVGELGYVFRGTPWKNIDFAFPESGDSALLDVFCIDDGESAEPLAAGRVDLNTRQVPVLRAVLAGAARREAALFGSTSALDLLAKGDGGESDRIARKLIARTSSLDSTKGPLTNVADLVGRYVGGSHANQTPYDGFSADLIGLYEGGATSAQNLLSNYRETAIRALSDTGMVGTWNLMIDLIAQSGKYNGQNFVVEGEKRYWVHVAIDRQTTKVIDQQIEEVQE